jgi:hypothetical protein
MVHAPAFRFPAPRATHHWPVHTHPSPQSEAMDGQHCPVTGHIVWPKRQGSHWTVPYPPCASRETDRARQRAHAPGHQAGTASRGCRVRRPAASAPPMRGVKRRPEQRSHTAQRASPVAPVAMWSSASFMALLPFTCSWLKYPGCQRNGIGLSFSTDHCSAPATRLTCALGVRRSTILLNR